MSVFRKFCLAHVRVAKATRAWKEAIPLGDSSLRKASWRALMLAKERFLEAEEEVLSELSLEESGEGFSEESEVSPSEGFDRLPF